MIDQEKIRKEIKLAKACNDDIYYKDFADYIEITQAAFYNWLNGAYELEYKKATKLHDIAIDLIDV